MACHTYDLWRLAFGSDPVRVTSRGFTFGEGKPDLEAVAELAPDTGVVLLEFASGDLGVFSISWGLPPGTESGANEDILGPQGAVGVSGPIVTLSSGEDRQEWECPESGEKALEVAALIDQIEGKEPRPTPAALADGRIALECSLASLESMRGGRSIEVGASRRA
jgi:predicted dehydrogenase